MARCFRLFAFGVAAICQIAIHADSAKAEFSAEAKFYVDVDTLYNGGFHNNYGGPQYPTLTVVPNQIYDLHQPQGAQDLGFLAQDWLLIDGQGLVHAHSVSQGSDVLKATSPYDPNQPDLTGAAASLTLNFSDVLHIADNGDSVQQLLLHLATEGKMDIQGAHGEQYASYSITGYISQLAPGGASINFSSSHDLSQNEPTTVNIDAPNRSILGPLVGTAPFDLAFHYTLTLQANYNTFWFPATVPGGALAAFDQTFGLMGITPMDSNGNALPLDSISVTADSGLSYPVAMVPEPGTWLLLLIGCPALAFFARTGNCHRG